MIREPKNGWLPLIALVVSIGVGGATLGLTPKCSDYETKAAAIVAHDGLSTRIEETRIDLRSLGAELKAQREDIHATQLQILKAVQDRSRR